METYSYAVRSAVRTRRRIAYYRFYGYVVTESFLYFRGEFFGKHGRVGMPYRYAVIFNIFLIILHIRNYFVKRGFGADGLIAQSHNAVFTDMYYRVKPYHIAHKRRDGFYSSAAFEKFKVFHEKEGREFIYFIFAPLEYFGNGFTRKV